MHRSQQPSARWLALGALTLALLVPAGGALGERPNASAALSPHVAFLGDSVGGVFTFTVTNPAGGEDIGMVDIDAPSRFWTAVSCPQAPAGWTAETDRDGCSYQNAGDPAGDLAPGTSSSAFQLVATSGEATADRTGTFRVAVGGSDASDDDDLTSAPAAAPGGLDVTAYSFEVLDVVVVSSPPAPGSPCPSANRTAAAGVDQVLVVCGRNRTSQTLVPAAASSSLGGTLLQAGGTFTSGPIPPSVESVALGSWSGVRTVRSGQDTTVTASIGSSSTQTSGPETLTGFVAVAAPVVANPQHVTTREDAPVGVVLGGSSGDGSPLTFAVARGPTHGTLSGPGPSLAYTPGAHYAGGDDFTFTASNGVSTSPPALVDISVEPVNHAPAFVRGSNVSVVATAGPQRFAHWATGISAGPASESSQALQFEVVGNTNPRLFSAGPAVSPSGDLTFTPNAGVSGSTTLTLVLRDAGGTANGGVDTSPPQTFTLTVVRPATPVADTRSATTVEDTRATLTLAAVDPGGGALTFSVASAPAHGTLGAIGPESCSGRPPICTVAVAYTPQEGYSGQDGFTYTVSDRQGSSSTAAVSIGVKALPAPPPPASPPKAPPPRPAPLPRRGPTLSAFSPARVPSGPPGVGLELVGSGYGCPSVYFFFDGSRVGVAHPDRAGQVQMTGLEIPGDAGIGRHVVETSCRASGTPVQVTSSFEVTSAALHRSVVMTSLPKPSDIHLTPKSTAATTLGAIALILLVAFPGGLLDTTLDEHYEEIRTMLGFSPRARATPRQLPLVLRLLGFVGFLAAGAVAGALLDPRFGFNRSTLALTVGLCVTLAVVFLGFELPGVVYRRSRFGEWGSLVLRPGALLLTALLVGTSRLLNLQPGYIFGVIGGLAFSSELRGKIEGRLAVLTSLFILVVALAMWFAWVPVSHAAARPGAGFWVVVAEAALGGTFLAGLSSLVVGLLPLRELDGSTLKSWSMVGWIAVYLVGVYVYVLLVLRPAAATGPDPHGQMWKALVAAGIFAALCITFWAYFRFRSRAAEASPAAEPG